MIPNTDRKILTVTQLNQQTRTLLEKNIPVIWVSGEISNLSQPSSLGHLYFSLKDESAQVKCAFFRQHSSKLDFQLKNGMHVYVQGQISLYEARGDYQLIAHNVEQAGIGALYKKLQQLKIKLQNEGLFDAQHKKNLPKLPNRIGVVTSPTGAAIRDVLTVLHRRFKSIPVIIYPTQVQGIDAAAQIATAVEIANLRQECDVLIITRGGGSLEDLWPFNEEIVARAIFKSKIPTISAVGHEIDFTISDFVADVRAPTPSAAAELVVPNVLEQLHAMMLMSKRVANLMLGKVQNANFKLQNLSNRLTHPQQKLQQNAQRLDDLERRLKRAMEQSNINAKKYLELITAKLLHQKPTQYIHKLIVLNSTLEKNLNLAIQNRVRWWQQKLSAISKNLDAVSPLATLHRGYAIATKNDKVISAADTKMLKCGNIIEVRLEKSELNCSINKITVIN